MKYATTGGEITHIVMNAPSIQDLTVFRKLLGCKEEIAELGLFGLFEVMMEKSINTKDEIIVPRQLAVEFHDMLASSLTEFVKDEYHTPPAALAKELAGKMFDRHFGHFLKELQASLGIHVRDL